MVYLTVETDMEDRLYLSRAPNFKSWAMAAGFISFGFALAYCSEVSEPMFLKTLYVMTGIIFGISSMDDWEECDFNKSKGQIKLRRCSVWDMLLYPFIDSRDVVIVEIDDVSEVNVNEEDLLFWGKTYQVVLQLKTGMSLPITKSFTFGLSNEHEEITQKIRSFLAQDSTTGGEVSSQDDAYIGVSSSAEEEEDDDDFEIIEEDDVDVINSNN